MEIIFFEKHLNDFFFIFTRCFVSVFFFFFFLSSWDVLAKPGSTKQSAKHSTGPMRNMQKKKKTKKKNTQTNKQKEKRKEKKKNKTKQSNKQTKTKQNKKPNGLISFSSSHFQFAVIFASFRVCFTIRPTCCKKMLFKKGINICLRIIQNSLVSVGVNQFSFVWVCGVCVL